jgi:type I restriction enzyme S subunit
MKVLFPLPPLPEQRAIAYVLRAVQRAREATERTIQAARELKKSLLRHLFTYGPVPVEHAERIAMQDTELGSLPAHWQVVRLGEVGEIITGKTPSTSEPRYWNGAIPFITPADLDKGEIYTTERTITQEGLAQVKAVPQGAVLVSCIGYIGKVGMVGVKIAATNQQINSIIPNVMVIDHHFLFHSLQAEGIQKMLDQLTRKTTLPILNKANFSKVSIPLPPLPEQHEIARILQAVDEKIRAEEARQQALDGLFKSLLHDLMAARRRLPVEFVAQFEKEPEVPS